MYSMWFICFCPSVPFWTNSGSEEDHSGAAGWHSDTPGQAGGENWTGGECLLCKHLPHSSRRPCLCSWRPAESLKAGATWDVTPSPTHPQQTWTALGRTCVALCLEAHHTFSSCLTGGTQSGEREAMGIFMNIQSPIIPIFYICLAEFILLTYFIFLNHLTLVTVKYRAKKCFLEEEKWHKMLSIYTVNTSTIM